MNTIFVGNAPCSWGNLEFDALEGEGLGYGQVLDELVETGYTGTELGDWGFMPTDPDALREELAGRSLAMLGAFVPVALVDPAAHGPGAAEAVKVARLLAAVADADHPPFLVLADDNGSVPARTKNAGRITPDLSLTDDQWAVFAQGAEAVAGAVLEEAGLRTVFHHHCAGYVETPDEIAALLDRTDPSLLGLVFDTGHFAYGTGSNIPYGVEGGLKRFKDRVWYVHFKDCNPDVATPARAEGWDYFQAVERGVFCELGEGLVDFPGVLEWLRERDYGGYITVEQDVLPGMGSPKESARRNREYLKEFGL